MVSALAPTRLLDRCQLPLRLLTLLLLHCVFSAQADLHVSTIPVALVPRDELREGLGTLRTESLISHPVEKIQLNVSHG